MADLSVSIGADITDFEKKLADAQKAVRDSFKSVDTSALEGSIRKLSVGLNQVGGSAEIFGRNISHSKQELKLYQDAFNDLLAQGLRPTHPEVLKLATEIDRLGREIEEASKPVRTLKDRLNDLSATGDKIAGIGGKLSIGLTAPLLLLGGSATKAYTELEGVQAAFERLGNSRALLDDLRASTKNTVSDLELMKNAVQALNFGLPVKELGKLLDFAGRRAKDTGQSVDYLVQSIVSGIGRKSPLILDNLGISASALKAEMGGVTMEAASVAQVTEAVGRIVSKELGKMGKDTNTLGEQFAQLKTITQNSLAKIGEILAPMLRPVVDLATKAALAFQNMSPELQKVAVVLGVVAAAAGPLLVAVGSFIKFIPVIISGVGGIKAAMVALTGPIGLVVAGLAAIVTVVVKNWDKIKPYFDSTVRSLKQIYNSSTTLQTAVKVLSEYFRIYFGTIVKVLDGVWQSFKAFGKGVLELFAGIGTAIRGALTGNIDDVKKGVNRGFMAILNTADGFSKAFKNTVGGIKDVFKGGAIFGGVPISIGVTEKNAGSIANDVTETVKKAGKKLKGKTIELPDVEVIVKPKLAGFLNALGEEFDTLQGMDNRARELADRVASPFEGIPVRLSDAAISIKENLLAIQDSFASMSDFGNFLGDAVSAAFNAVTDTIANSFSAIGEAMAQGESIFGAFGNAILSGIGSFLGELGKMMIQYGVAALAMSVLSKMLTNPITAAPAALAMIAAGAALSAISGAIKGHVSGAGKGSVGGSVSTSGGGGWSGTSSFSTGGGMGSGEVVFRISGNDLVGVLSRQMDKNRRLGG